jgi:hypothetical protein
LGALRAELDVAEVVGWAALRAELDAWVGSGDGCSVRRDVLQVELGESVGSAGVRWVGRGEFRAGRDVFQRGELMVRCG